MAGPIDAGSVRSENGFGISRIIPIKRVYLSKSIHRERSSRAIPTRPPRVPRGDFWTAPNAFSGFLSLTDRGDDDRDIIDTYYDMTV